MALPHVVTPKGRLSFPHLFKPSAAKGSTAEKFSATILVPKTMDITNLRKALEAAAVEKWGADKAKWPRGMKPSPIADGDGDAGIDNTTGKTRDGYAGCWAIKASSDARYKPQIVDANGEEILSESDVYPGCYVRFALKPFAYDNVARGVSFILDHVQKLGDAPSFSSRKAAKDVFGPVAGAASEESEGADDFGF